LKDQPLPDADFAISAFLCGRYPTCFFKTSSVNSLAEQTVRLAISYPNFHPDGNCLAIPEYFFDAGIASALKQGMI